MYGWYARDDDGDWILTEVDWAETPQELSPNDRQWRQQETDRRLLAAFPGHEHEALRAAAKARIEAAWEYLEAQSDAQIAICLGVAFHLVHGADAARVCDEVHAQIERQFGPVPEAGANADIAAAVVELKAYGFLVPEAFRERYFRHTSAMTRASTRSREPDRTRTSARRFRRC